MRVRNTSDQEQHFNNIGTFAPGEAKEVDADTAEYLLKSPHIVKDQTPTKGVEKTKSFKGVEKDK